MKRRTFRKTVALLFAATVIADNIAVSPCITSVQSNRLCVDAAADTVSFDASSGTLTLKGEVNRDEFTSEVDASAVKKVVAEVGTVFPGYSAGLFSTMTGCTTFDLKNADTSNVHNMSAMFYGCSSVKELDLSGWNTSAVTDMAGMFSNCTALEKVDIGNFDTSNTIQMTAMFMSCPNLTEADVSGFDTRKTESFANMFYGCKNLRKIDTSGFLTYRAKSVQFMFADCENLISLDLSGFETAELSEDSKASMFSGASGLRSLKLGSGFGSLNEDMRLDNSGKGWADANDPNTCISGNSFFASADIGGKEIFLQHRGMKENIISGASLILDGTIGLNYFVSFSGDLTDEQKSSAYIVFEGNCSENGQALSLSGSSVTCHVAAKNTGDKIKAALYIDGQAADIKSLSVKDYADIILANPETYPKEQELVKALLTYCGNAQRLFGYNESSPVDEGIFYTGSPFSYTTVFTQPDPISGLAYHGSSLLLRSGTSQRHYFKLAGGNISDYTFTLSGSTAKPVQYEDSDYYYIDRDNINAASLEDAATVTVTKGSEELSFRYSPMDYVSTVLSEDSIQSDELKNMALSLYWYSNAALKYAGRA